MLLLLRIASYHSIFFWYWTTPVGKKVEYLMIMKKNVNQLNRYQGIGKVTQTGGVFSITSACLAIVSLTAQQGFAFPPQLGVLFEGESNGALVSFLRIQFTCFKLLWGLVHAHFKVCVGWQGSTLSALFCISVICLYAFSAFFVRNLWFLSVKSKKKPTNKVFQKKKKKPSLSLEK